LLKNLTIPYRVYISQFSAYVNYVSKVLMFLKIFQPMEYIINIVNLVAIKIYSFSYESWNYMDDDRQEIEQKILMKKILIKIHIERI